MALPEREWEHWDGETGQTTDPDLAIRMFLDELIRYSTTRTGCACLECMAKALAEFSKSLSEIVEEARGRPA